MTTSSLPDTSGTPASTLPQTTGDTRPVWAVGLAEDLLLVDTRSLRPADVASWAGHRTSNVAVLPGAGRVRITSPQAGNAVGAALHLARERLELAHSLHGFAAVVGVGGLVGAPGARCVAEVRVTLARGESAAAVADAAATHLPELAALSANGPPVPGTPRVEAGDGTVTLVTDTQTRAEDVLALAAVFQALVAWLEHRQDVGDRAHAGSAAGRRMGPDGVETTRERIADLLRLLRPDAVRLGVLDGLFSAGSLLAGNGLERQQIVGRSAGRDGLVRWLARETAESAVDLISRRA